MIHAFQIMVFSCAIALLAGCNIRERDVPVWEHVKIGDLAASHNTKRPTTQLLRTVSFNVYIFEIPAENISTLDNIWQSLHTKPLRFNDYEAFGANSFSVGFGQLQMWNKIADLLQAAGARKAETITLLLSAGQADDIAIAGLAGEQTIFYISTAGSMEGATIGPGTLALRIKAEKIPGAIGICNIHVLPVFLPLIKSPVPRLNTYARTDEFHFTPAGFGLKMSPNGFFFLGPEKYISNQITLGGLLFSKPGRKPVARVFLFVCTSISD